MSDVLSWTKLLSVNESVQCATPKRVRELFQDLGDVCTLLGFSPTFSQVLLNGYATVLVRENNDEMLYASQRTGALGARFYNTLRRVFDCLEASTGNLYDCRAQTDFIDNLLPWQETGTPAILEYMHECFMDCSVSTLTQAMKSGLVLRGSDTLTLDSELFALHPRHWLEPFQFRGTIYSSIAQALQDVLAKTSAQRELARKREAGTNNGEDFVVAMAGSQADWGLLLHELVKAVTPETSDKAKLLVASRHLELVVEDVYLSWPFNSPYRNAEPGWHEPFWLSVLKERRQALTAGGQVPAVLDYEQLQQQEYKDGGKALQAFRSLCQRLARKWNPQSSAAEAEAQVFFGNEYVRKWSAQQKKLDKDVTIWEAASSASVTTASTITATYTTANIPATAVRTVNVI